MFFNFFSNQWKYFWRGTNIGTSIAVKVLLIIISVYLLLIAIAAGLLMNDIIARAFPDKAPVHVFISFIIYYFLFDFLARIQLQELPALSLQPYLTQNVPKRSIVRYLNFQTLFNFFNIAPLFIFLPFCFTVISVAHGRLAAIAIAVAVISLALFNNFFTLWIKRKGGNNGWVLVAGAAVALALAGLDYVNVLSLRRFSDAIFSSVIAHPFFTFIFTGLALFAFLLSSRFLYKNLYLEELSPGKSEKIGTSLPLFNRFGTVGQLAALEVKLILRHKRSRGAVTAGLIVALIYALTFFTGGAEGNHGFKISYLLIAFIITSVFQISYGQFMFAWQSSHFDALMVSPIKTSDYIRAKFLLFNVSGAMTVMFCLLFALISWKIVFAMLCMALYSAGFATVIVLFFAAYNKKRLELSRGVVFNYQGSGVTQWIMAIPVAVIPLLNFYHIRPAL